MKFKEKKVPTIISAILIFTSGIIFNGNRTISIIFLFIGIWCLLSILKRTPEIHWGSQEEKPPNPKSVPKGSLYSTYKKYKK